MVSREMQIFVSVIMTLGSADHSVSRFFCRSWCCFELCFRKSIPLYTTPQHCQHCANVLNIECMYRRFDLIRSDDQLRMCAYILSYVTLYYFVHVTYWFSISTILNACWPVHLSGGEQASRGEYSPQEPSCLERCTDCAGRPWWTSEPSATWLMQIEIAMNFEISWWLLWHLNCHWMVFGSQCLHV